MMTIAVMRKGEQMTNLRPMEVIMRIDFVASNGKQICAHAEKVQELIRCKDCKFYTAMNRETKSGICSLIMHQNFGDDWYCAGAERRTDG